MNWYYAAGGQQKGPVDEAELDALLQSGQITQESLVWREGMANWQPLSQARPAAATPPAMGAAPATVSADASSTAAGAAIGDVVCAECGKLFTKENTIQYGTAWVCASCKPIFLQRLREGGSPGSGTLGLGDVRYAGFWIRFAAKFIDWIVAGVILGIPALVLLFAVGIGFKPGQQPGAPFVIMQVLIQIVSIGFSIGYNTFLIGKYGATLGKMALGLRVSMVDGSKPTYMRAFGRAWAEILSGMICNIGYIIAAFDAEKRSLHDHICQTRVVYK